MIKFTLILAGMLALAACFVVYSDEASSSESTCLYANECWGGEDVTKFYFCVGDTVIEQPCPKNTIFVRNATTSGCVALKLMDPDCVYLDEVEPCSGDNLLQPQPSIDPTKFYLCTGEGADPLLLPCTNNQAFVKQDGYMGCFNWTMWRSVRHCSA